MAGHLVVCPCGYIHLYFNLYAIATSLEWLLSERWPLWKGSSVFKGGGGGGEQHRYNFKSYLLLSSVM